MRRLALLALAGLVTAIAALLLRGDGTDYSAFDTPVAAAEAILARGEYVFAFAGCAPCHTAEEEGSPPLAGGRALETSFGIFYSPNITPDRATGIGDWTAADLARALREGVSPGGRHYYPAFPYTSYGGISDEDVRGLYAYLQRVPAIVREHRPHELRWYLRLPGVMRAWKLLFFDPPAAPARSPTEPATRGAYLAEVLGHCGECHTPRNSFGALDRSQHLAGPTDGPEGKSIPNITPAESGIGGWSARRLEFFLQTGMLPDGDFVGGRMATVIDESTSRLERDDLDALVGYLRALPPIERQPESPPAG